MVDRDVVLAKVAAVDRYLGRIEDVRRRGDLRPIDAQDVVELNLQRAVQAAIDLAAHVVASQGWGLVDHVGAAFDLLRDHGVIDGELAALMRRMVGFRNIAVHEYQTVDPEVVERIVEDHLDDLRRLCRLVVQYLGLR
jgi:uncharacterized protein YutE (UPF0331/DUF86 family)